MLSQKLTDAINKQINAEFYSAYLYLSMGAYFETQSLSGFANWMRIQFQEEQAHGFMMFDYLVSRGVNVKLDAIQKPETEFGTPTQVFEQVLEHEKEVTAGIHNLMAIAIEEKDYASTSFLQWFIDEQVEEEASAEDVIAQLKIAGDTGRALLMFDREFAARTYIAPTRN